MVNVYKTNNQQVNSAQDLVTSVTATESWALAGTEFAVYSEFFATIFRQEFNFFVQNFPKIFFVQLLRIFL